MDYKVMNGNSCEQTSSIMWPCLMLMSMTPTHPISIHPNSLLILPPLPHISNQNKKFP